MPELAAATREIAITIGGMPILVRTASPELLSHLEKRFGGFTGAPEPWPAHELDVEVGEHAPAVSDPEEGVHVQFERGCWVMERGDLWATWDAERRRGQVRQGANAYSLDTVVRIIHTLVLANEGGFLLHAASAVRNGRAFLFSGVSGAGKTTISRLAPADATLLTDEISYVRPAGNGYVAYGTPFAGELAIPGDNVRAPIDTLFFLEQGKENRIDDIGSPSKAARLLMKNILFFAQDAKLVKKVFESALNFVERVSVKRLTFLPDQRVWELIK